MARPPFWQRRLNPEARERANVKIRQRAEKHIARRAEIRARRERVTEERRRIAREEATRLGVHRKVNAPFYARRLPDDAPRLWGDRRRPVWVDPSTASTLGRYNNAIRQLFIPGGDISAIDEFIDMKITDRDGNVYELVTSAAEIRRFIEGGKRIDYVKNYRAQAA